MDGRTDDGGGGGEGGWNGREAGILPLAMLGPILVTRGRPDPNAGCFVAGYTPISIWQALLPRVPPTPSPTTTPNQLPVTGYPFLPIILAHPFQPQSAPNAVAKYRVRELATCLTTCLLKRCGAGVKGRHDSGQYSADSRGLAIHADIPLSVGRCSATCRFGPGRIRVGTEGVQ